LDPINELINVLITINI